MPACRSVVAASGATAAAVRRKNKEKEEKKKVAAAPPAEEEEEPEYTGFRKWFHKFVDFVDQTWLQTCFYIFFLLTFQMLTNTMRHPEEFYMDKFISDTFIINTFDAPHNTLKDMRRVADIWEWCNTVLTPGLFSNADSGENWPDGSGSFHLEGATPLSVQDVVYDMNNFDFTRGIMFKQVRATEIPGRSCYGDIKCFSDLKPAVADPGDAGNTTSFGFGEAEGHFKYWSPAMLGANPAGLMSANPLSLRTWSSGGFIAIYKPFFSEVYLPDEQGKYFEVTDYRHTEARLDNGKQPNYYCARYTTNGHEITQRCNPDPSASSGVTRQMMSEMLDYLKRGHWIDKQTRMMSITIQARSNNGQVRYLSRFMFELTGLGAVLPSFDMESMIDDDVAIEDMKAWMFVALCLTLWFVLLEVIEVSQSGPSAYFTNLWNVMDWANFILFFQVYRILDAQISLQERDRLRMDFGAQGAEPDCGSVLCNQFGFMDTWEVMFTAREAKFYMSICVCLQLLKIIKFTNVIVPKMSLMTSVLAKGCYDLLFFGIIFGLSMFAFCQLFYIQLGSFMDDYHSQTSSIIALALALFGDFPFEEILDNSRGYVNGILFLVYLFVAVFILLSMFLAILGEAQAAAREAENEAKEAGTFGNEYGIFGYGKEWLVKQLNQMRGKGAMVAEAAEEEAGGDSDDELSGESAAVQTAMLQMQTRLEASFKQRMTSVESRVLKELGRFRQEEREALARLDARLGGERPPSPPPDMEESSAEKKRGAKEPNGGASADGGCACAPPGRQSSADKGEGERAAPTRGQSVKRGGSRSFPREAHDPEHARNGRESTHDRRSERDRSRSRTPTTESPSPPQRRSSRGDGDDASKKVRAASTLQPERKPSLSAAEKIVISPAISPRDVEGLGC